MRRRSNAPVTERNRDEGLRPKALAIIFILIFLVLLIAGVGIGDLEEILFNGRML
jgi:hypothetical protein